MTVLSEPSAFIESTRPPLRSRTNSRPVTLLLGSGFNFVAKPSVILTSFKCLGGCALRDRRGLFCLSKIRCALFQEGAERLFCFRGPRLHAEGLVLRCHPRGELGAGRF